MNDDFDTVLLSKDGADAIQQKVALHTVPIHFFRGNAELGKWSSSGSGVLVKLGGRYFIFTAGHCVRDAGNASDAIVVGVRNSLHRFQPNLERRNHLLGRGIDVGYFEVPQVDAITMESGNRVFLSASSLRLASSEWLKEQSDWMVISGYPIAIVEGDVTVNPGARLLVYSTTIAGTGDAPAATFTCQAQSGELDLWIPSKGNVDTLNPDNLAVTVPVLRGASGGGCWTAGVRPHLDEKWHAGRLRLVGIHTGSCDSIEIKGENHVFAREYLLIHYFKLIAEDYPDLREYILENWPDAGLGI